MVQQYSFNHQFNSLCLNEIHAFIKYLHVSTNDDFEAKLKGGGGVV